MYEIAKLTFREGMRKRAWIATFLGLMVVLLLALIPFYSHGMGTEGVTQKEFGVHVGTDLGVRVIEFFASIIAVLLCAGTVSGELDRGVLSVILPKPLYRSQILFGKWLGIMWFVFLNAILWSLALCIEMQVQSKVVHLEIWRALPFMMLYPILYGTMTFVFSTLVPMAPAVILTSTGYMFATVGDGIIRLLGDVLNLSILKKFTVISEWLVPHARLTQLIEYVMRNNLLEKTSRRFDPTGAGLAPHIEPFNIMYVVGYLIALFFLGVLIFQRRDVQ